MNLFQVTKKQPSGGLELKTATGDIASFKTNYSEPLPAPFNSLNVKCDITAKQDLHGYDHPWVGGAGKNKCESSYTTGSQTIYATVMWIECDLQPSTTYAISFDGTSGTSFYSNENLFETSAYFDVTSSRTSVIVTTKDSIIKSADTYDEGRGWKILKNSRSQTVVPAFNRVQLEAGNQATPYEPYSNICPIVGHSELNLVRCGVNLWNGDSHDGKGMGGTGTEYTDTASFATLFVPVVPSTTIYLNPTNWRNWINWYKADQTFLSQSVVDSNNEITVPIGAAYARFTGILAEKATAMVCFASQKTEPYAPYNGDTFTVQFGQTVYGGVYDANRGKVTVTHKCIAISKNWVWYKSNLYNGSFYTYGWENADINDLKENTPFICSHLDSVTSISDYVYGKCFSDNAVNLFIMAAGSSVQDFKDYIDAQAAANTPIQICYELATPIEIDVSELSVDTIVGTNNVFHDGNGDTEVKYLDVV